MDDIDGLITLPDVYLRVSKLLEDPNTTSHDIAKAISQDASFTVKLLKLADSPMYGFASKVDSVAKAVTLIGTRQIRSLARSLSVAGSFGALPNDLVTMRNFWKHSLLCALAARHRRTDHLQPAARTSGASPDDGGRQPGGDQRPGCRDG